MAHSSSAKTFLLLGAILGGLAVVAGAFGAHALKEVLEPDQLISYKTAVRYQMWHALLLVALSFGPVFQSKQGSLIGWLIVAGTACFSGSIYGLTFTTWKFLGPITPLGGLLLLLAWILLAVTATRKERK